MTNVAVCLLVVAGSLLMLAGATVLNRDFRPWPATLVINAIALIGCAFQVN